MRGAVVGADGDPDCLTKEQQTAWNSKVEDYRAGYDAILEDHAGEFQDLLRCGDINGYWRLWCRIFDTAGKKAAKLDGEMAKEYNGHGVFDLKAKVSKAPAAKVVGDKLVNPNLSSEASRNKTLATTCRQWADRVDIMRKGKAGIQQMVSHIEHNGHAKNHLMKFCNLHNTFEKDLLDMVTERDANTYLGFSSGLRKAANCYGKTFDDLAVAGKSSTRKARAEAQQECVALKHLNI